MSDETSSNPPRVPVTAQWLAEQQRKRDIYENARRRHYEQIERQSRGDPDELDEAEAVPTSNPTSNPAAQPRRHSRGKINDPRQLKLGL